jgi:hypothetical protein
MTTLIPNYCDRIINGVGGLHDFEDSEWAVPVCDRDTAVAMWVVRCLANPSSENSDRVLSAIIQRRRQIRLGKAT